MSALFGVAIVLCVGIAIVAVPILFNATTIFRRGR